MFVRGVSPSKTFNNVSLRGVIKGMTVTPKIDEFTVVLQPSSTEFDIEEWTDWKAHDLINTFLIKSKLTMLFSDFAEADVSLPSGYNIGYSFNNSPFYLAIAYHSIFVKMGVIVKFSAYAWDQYKKRYAEYFNEPMHIHTFFRMIDAEDYNFRLSRVDIAIDYKNENVNIAQLYRSLMAERTGVFYGK